MKWRCSKCYHGWCWPKVLLLCPYRTWQYYILYYILYTSDPAIVGSSSMLHMVHMVGMQWLMQYNGSGVPSWLRCNEMLGFESATPIPAVALPVDYCSTSVAVPVLLYQYCCTGIAVPVLLYQHCSTSVAVSVLLYQYCCTQLTLLHSPNNLSHVLYLSYFVTCPSYFVFWLRCFVFALFLPLSPPVFGRSTGVRRWRPWLSDLLPTGLKSFPRVA